MYRKESKAAYRLTILALCYFAGSFSLPTVSYALESQNDLGAESGDKNDKISSVRTFKKLCDSRNEKTGNANKKACTCLALKTANKSEVQKNFITYFKDQEGSVVLSKDDKELVQNCVDRKDEYGIALPKDLPKNLQVAGDKKET